MSSDYSTLGYSRGLKKIGGLCDRTQSTGGSETQRQLNRQDFVRSIDFDTKYEVSASHLNASKVNLIDFAKQSPIGTALGTFSTSPALNLTSEITFEAPHGTVKTFGLPAVAIYQGAGTAGSNQIYPIRGGSVTLGRYSVVGGGIDFNNYDWTSCQWRAMIIDSNGTSTQTITFATQWLYLDYVSRGVV